MKLHLGCGKRFLDGFTHVDAYDGEHIDVVCDIREIEKHFAAGSVEEIYASHVLEHFGRHEVQGIVDSWARLLCPGGRLRIAVPDLEAVFAHFAIHGDMPVVTGMLYGGQVNELDYHKIGFTFRTLSDALARAGLPGAERYEWRDFLPEGKDDYSRSYLPHMDFENGRLMSLNVVATRPL
jgi:predicted SAM-dependent methyltransferase